MSQSVPGRQEHSLQRITAAAPLLYLVLSLVLTYPLALHLADAVEDRQDALLNVWITAWDGHQLLNDPAHLFDANIFFPYPRTLAYSELLLGNGLLSLPITAATANPVLGYNLALLLSFVLSGLGTYLLVLRLTRSPAAGLVAGLVFGFSSYRLTNLAQAQLLTTQWMPFALLSLYQLLRRPRARHLATFVLFFCLQALSSFYYGLLLALTVAGLVVFDSVFWIWARFRGQTAGSGAGWDARPLCPPYLLLAICCCAAVILPFALPYFQVQRELGFERTLADSEPFSASLRQYMLVPPRSVIHGRWLPSDDTPLTGGYPADALFPGLVALGLGFWGLVRGQGRPRWFFLVLLVAAFCLSLGPRLYLSPGEPAALDLTLPYAWLYPLLPGFKALRAPVRFDALVMLALAVLAGYGAGALLDPEGQTSGDTEHGGRSAWDSGKRLLLTTCLLLLVTLEMLVWPGAKAEPVPVGDQVPPGYRWLAAQPPGPVLELPMAFTPGGPQLEYQYLSTYHWRTTPDGYSGFIPPKHGEIRYEMDRFPSERSVSLLQALDVRREENAMLHVVIHSDRYPATRQSEIQSALAQTEDLRQVVTFGADQVYELEPRSFEASTLEVNGYLPPQAVTGQPYTAYAIAINTGPRSYAIRPTDVIRPAATWTAVAGGATPTDQGSVQADVPLVTSPDGGASVIPLPLTAPSAPGTYDLTIREKGGPLGDWQFEGAVEVGEQGSDAFPVPAQLAAWSVPARVQRGQPLEVNLTWRALGKIDAYYSVYVKVLDAEGRAIASWDGQPRDGEAPTLLWVPGETVDDTVMLMVPAGAPLGEHTVEVGMYRAEDLTRCLTLNNDGRPVDRLVLGSVQIEP